MKMNRCKIFLIVIFLIGCIVPLQAQRIAVSTNVVDLFTLTPNVEVEFSINHKRSFAFAVDASPFQLSEELNFAHLSISGEYRFWIDQIYYAHYISVAAQLSSYDSNVAGYSLSGDFCTLGVGYGYSLMINRKFNIVPNVAVGYGYDLNSIGGEPRFEPMLINVGVSFQYLIK